MVVENNAEVDKRVEVVKKNLKKVLLRKNARVKKKVEVKTKAKVERMCLRRSSTKPKKKNGRNLKLGRNYK